MCFYCFILSCCGRLTNWFFQAKRDLHQGDPLSPPIYFCFVQRVYLSCSTMLNRINICRVWKSTVEALLSLIYYLQTTQFFLAGHQCNNVKTWLKYWILTKRLVVKWWTSTNLPFSLTATPLNRSEKPLLVSSKFLTLVLRMGYRSGSEIKKGDFNFIKDKVAKKLCHWKRDLLSVSGKEVLIKAVGIAIPIYSFGCFRLPDSLLDEIHKMIVNFWWGQKNNERKQSWIGWKTLCRPKSEGRLGFKDLKVFNLAMLGK